MRVALVAAVFLWSCAGNERECVLGTWTGSRPSCASHPWCSSSSPASECALSDCVVADIYRYSADGGVLTGSIQISESSRSFTRGPAEFGDAWDVKDGKLLFGGSWTVFSCTPKRLVLGEGPFSVGRDRADSSFAAAWTAAVGQGNTTSVGF